MDRRLTGTIDRGRPVQIVMDGVAVPAFEGESVAAALLAAGRRTLRVTPRHSEPRGMYCGIGLCFECVMSIDGRRSVRACQTPVRDGMRVGTPRDRGGPSPVARADAGQDAQDRPRGARHNAHQNAPRDGHGEAR